jgi:hypothetical membrane protein
MNGKSAAWFKISAVCGILTPIIAFTFIFLAIASFPEFSWTNNALSDLGVQEGIAAVLFNSGLIISGILAFVFAVGLVKFLSEQLLGRIGALVFAIDTLMLVAIGVFSENFGRIHYYVSVMFFALFPISILIIFATLLHRGKVKTGLFTLLVAAIAAVAWIIQFTIKFGSNVAIPETISALSASAWSIVLGFQMFEKASQSAQ